MDCWLLVGDNNNGNGNELKVPLQLQELFRGKKLEMGIYHIKYITLNW